MKTVKIRPTISYSDDPSARPADGWLTAEFLKYGAPATILTQDVSFPDLGDKGIIRLIKAPGSDVHRFPESMRDLGQAIADHQYSASPAAHDKACILTYRKTTLSAEKRLPADKLHAHSMLKDKEYLLRALVFAFALLKHGAVHPSLLSLSAELSLNEYLLTDIEPTFIQSAAAKEDLLVTHNGAGLVSGNADAIPQTRAPEKSLLFITSQVFHRAPTANDFAPESLGKERRLLDVMYMPANAAKKLIHP